MPVQMMCGSILWYLVCACGAMQLTNTAGDRPHTDRPACVQAAHHRRAPTGVPAPGERRRGRVLRVCTMVRMEESCVQEGVLQSVGIQDP